MFSNEIFRWIEWDSERITKRFSIWNITELLTWKKIFETDWFQQTKWIIPYGFLLFRSLEYIELKNDLKIQSKKFFEIVMKK